MPRLPDRFDLWVRKARDCNAADRQADYLLGALAGLSEWHFLNVGTKETPQPAEAEMEDGRHLLVFSGPDRIEEMLRDAGRFRAGDPPPVITMPTARAMAWCLERRVMRAPGLLVNPGENAFLIPLDRLETFYAEWSNRGGRSASGFWIPNMTTEEEDFWQEHGL
jgi:hypothetical protein